MKKQKALTPSVQEKLLSTLKMRFEQNSKRHRGIEWRSVEKSLHAHPEKIWSLHEMEHTGGEPDVTRFDSNTGEYLFTDCSPESPAGRRSVCCDREGQLSRTEHMPENNAVDIAAAMGIALLNEEQYRALQQLGPFDTKTSSWLLTPLVIRKLGGALFGDYRYGTVFVYHTGAQAYYAARGFRGMLRV